VCVCDIGRGRRSRVKVHSYRTKKEFIFDWKVKMKLAKPVTVQAGTGWKADLNWKLYKYVTTSRKFTVGLNVAKVVVQFRLGAF